MSSLPTVSVIIPVHAPGDAFQRCLDGLAQSTQQPMEVIIVFDGEPAVEPAIDLDGTVHVIRNATPQGPARARNQGARDAEGDVLLFLDSDVVPSPGVIENVATHFQDERADALVGSYDADPGDPRFLSQYRNLLHHYVHQTSGGRTCTFWGACGAIRTAAFHDLGGFDEQYTRPCIEDVELGLRASEAGYRIDIVPSIQVKHLKRWTALSMLKTDVFDRALPWTRLLLARKTVPNNLNLRVRERWSTVIAFVLLGALLGALLWPPVGLVALIAAPLFVALGTPLYRFFWRHRGSAFTLRAIPWHLTYYLCCGTGAALGLAITTLTALGVQKTPLHRLAPRPI